MNFFFHYAIQQGNVALVELLLTESLIKVDVNAVGSDGCTPLAVAVKMKNTVIVQMLLEAESDPNICDYDGFSPIHHAIQLRDVAMLQILLEESLIKVDVNVVGSDGCTPLALAVTLKNTGIVKMLLEAESDPNICDNHGRAPIYTAIQHGDIAVVQLLLDESLIKLDVNISYGCSPISYAVKMKNFTIVKLLLQAEADPNVLDYDGYATIHYAVSYRDIGTVKLLLTESSIEVDVNIEQHEGDTALMIAIRKNDAAIARLLIEAGANVNFISNWHGDYRFTPFMEASHQNLRMCQLLIEYGYDVNKHIFKNYRSAVHFAATINVDIVRYLVMKCKANIFKEPGMLVDNIISNKRPKVLDYILQHAYKLRGDEVWWDYEFPGPLHQALNHHSVTCISVLLRWGLNNAVCNIPTLDLGYILPHFITQYPRLYVSASAYITVIKLLNQLYPQSLQDEWIIENRNTNVFSFSLEMEKFLGEQFREGRNPSRLNIICRTKIFHQLGYNPISKAEKLPLPRILINFVQFQDVKDLHVASITL